MNPIRSNSNRNYIKNKIHTTTLSFKNHLSKTVAKIRSLFHHELEIFHLGGTRLGSVDRHNIQKKMNQGYFYERIPIKTAAGEVFLYGNTLKPYVKNWMNAVKRNAFSGTFQEYMEKYSQLESLAPHKVRYFTPLEQKQSEVSFVKGIPYQLGLDSTEKKPKIMAKGTYAFVIADVMTENGTLQPKLFAAIKGDTSSGKIQHSSFARAGNVISAGTFEIKKGGKIVSISNYSGHYRPTKKELFFCLKHLSENGYQIDTCYVQHYKNILFMGLAHIIPIKGFAAVLTRADKWMNEYIPDGNLNPNESAPTEV